MLCSLRVTLKSLEPAGLSSNAAFVTYQHVAWGGYITSLSLGGRFLGMAGASLTGLLEGVMKSCVG